MKRGAAPVRRPTNHAVGYVRVSSVEQQQEGYSIEAQLRLLRDYAARHDLKIVQEFVEVETAKQTGRATFAAMLEYLKAHPEVQDILVENTDRLYRNIQDWGLCDSLPYTTHFVRDGLMLSKQSRASEKLMHGIKVVFAKHYVDNLADETKKGMVQKALQGFYPGKPPLGYVSNPLRKRLELDPTKAPLIRELFDLYASGDWSLDELREYMHARGLTSVSGRMLYKSNLREMLQNPMYYGHFYWKDTLYPGKHEPMITKSLWDRGQAAMQRHNRARAGKYDFPFTGLLTCFFCGCAITAEMKKGTYIYYHCTGNHGPCQKPRIRQERLEAQLEGIVRGITIDDQTAAWLLARLEERRAEDEAHQIEIVQELERQIAQLDHRIDQAYTDKLDGAIPEAVVLRNLNTWQSRRATLQDRLHGLMGQHGDLPRTKVQEIIELANHATVLYKSREAHEKAQLLKTIQSNCRWDGETPHPVYRKPFDVLAHGVQTGDWVPKQD